MIVLVGKLPAVNNGARQQTGWRAERRSGIGAIAVAGIVGVLLWLGIYSYAPAIGGMESLDARMLFALKCVAVATLFCLVAGVEAVAHERFQSAAFDPLDGHGARRLAVNQRYLQNTLEQLVVFAIALFGLSAYMTDGESMRAVLATTVVWVVSRAAFWVGYHRSAAMRGLGAPGMIASVLALLYVAWRVGAEVAGAAGGSVFIGAFLLLEVLLFWETRARD
jgi:hypothetical protein